MLALQFILMSIVSVKVALGDSLRQNLKWRCTMKQSGVLELVQIRSHRVEKED